MKIFDLPIAIIFSVGFSFLHANFSSADVAPDVFEPGPNVPAGFKPTKDMNVAGTDFSGSRFQGFFLGKANFSGCNLQRCKFLEVHFKGASFRGADLRFVTITSSKVLRDCDVTDARIDGTPLSLSVEQLMSTRNYKQRDLSHCSIWGAREVAKDGGWITIEEPIQKLKLSGFRLAYTQFCRVDVTGVDFSNSDLTGIWLFQSTISQTQIENSAAFSNSIAKRLDPRSQVFGRSSFTYDQEYQGMYFNTMDLSGWDFSNRNVRYTSFVGCKLEEANFENADVTGAFLSGPFPTAKLQETKNYRLKDLSGIKLEHVDLRNLDFSGFNLTGVTFLGCKVDGLKLDKAIITGAELINHGLPKGQLTVEQIRSTWNYQHDRMQGITLPSELREALQKPPKVASE